MALPTPTPVEPALPPVDERLVAPETRFEIHDGELVYVSPADPPHATRHSKISALVEAHAGDEFDVASDMLTRTSKTSDVAPDVSVFPYARDPRTGGRQIEQLAFEVVSTQTLGAAGRKAAKLATRGVRRVFAIDLERARALEWSAALGAWQPLALDESIEDPALAVPLPVDALVHAAKVDDAVARALLAKHNPVLEADRERRITEAAAQGRKDGLLEGMARGEAEGMARGKAEALLVLLAARGLLASAEDRARILAEGDPGRLDRWIARAASCTEISALFAGP